MIVLLALLAGPAAFPGSAEAHGPVAPVALDYLARVGSAPGGLVAKVVDGDQRMWLRAPRSVTVVVLDYRGAPYLRFSARGVEVNHHSAMFYLNKTPIAQNPPPTIGPKTPPDWQLASTGHEYGWHDGRLHALAAVALRPGDSYVGRWRVPILIDGRLSELSGGLWHANPPSIVWFWPMVVLWGCVLAAWRLRSATLDRWLTRVLALGALAAVAVAGVGRELHGRPMVTSLQRVELGVILAFVAWGVIRVLSGRARFISYFVIAIVALWEGLELIPVLDNGFVLIALPAFVARAAAVTALGASAALGLLVFRPAEQPRQSIKARARVEELEGEDDGALELA